MTVLRDSVKLQIVPGPTLDGSEGSPESNTHISQHTPGAVRLTGSMGGFQLFFVWVKRGQVIVTSMLGSHGSWKPAASAAGSQAAQLQGL